MYTARSGIVERSLIRSAEPSDTEAGVTAPAAAVRVAGRRGGGMGAGAGEPGCVRVRVRVRKPSRYLSVPNLCDRVGRMRSLPVL